MFDVIECTIAQLLAAYLDGAATARDVTQAYLDRIDRFDRRGPYLNAIIRVNSHALGVAEELDSALRSSGRLSGPLHGIPVIVKDNLDTADIPTTSGVACFKDFVPDRDAFIVGRLRSAGAIVLAKASLSELSMGLADSINSVLPGFTRNPYNTAYASGGSSGGTAVALAANFGTVGLGTDTGGSVRAPASINNLVGVRPTVGLVSRTGMAPLDSQRDTPGPMARTVEDAARLLDVIAGADPHDPRTATAASHIPATYVPLPGSARVAARVGVLRQALALSAGADPRVVALFDAAVADLGRVVTHVDAGFQVPGLERFPIPPQTAARTRADWDRFFASAGPRFPLQSVAQLRDLPPGKGVHPLHRPRIAEIAAVSVSPEDDPETVQGRQDEQMYREAFTQAMDRAQVEALVFPVWTYPPVINGDRGQSLQGPLTHIGSATQWPVVVVPIGFAGEQLPIGMQILGKPWTEARLIQIAHAFEQATHHRRPPGGLSSDERKT
ncbi:MAG: amidase [Chloroflexi bacterium]|nr:amidase [Chloroflexota bacterium]